MLCGLGAISIGHGRDAFAMFGSAALDASYGWLPSLPSTIEAATAHEVIDRVAPWASRVKFVKTGSEALTAAVMIARQQTRRSLVLVARGSYHGWHPWTSLRGTDAVDAQSTVEYEYGDRERILDWAPCAAAIVYEPPRWVDLGGDYLGFLRDLATRTGALLLVDEMIYGGRWALGGACETHGVEPDLACYGKALGNGAPIACVVGRDALDEFGQHVSGTYSGDVLALTAMRDVVWAYRSMNVCETLWRRGHTLALALDELAATSRGRAVREGAAVHQRLRFRSLDGSIDVEAGRAFALEMSRRNVLWHPDCVNVMYMHTADVIEQVCVAARESMRAVLG